MGTGIVSIGLLLDHQQTLSQILLGVAVAFWLGLLAVFVDRRLRQRSRWQQEARAADVLTIVAGTAVLGDRLTLLGEDWAGYLLLVLAFTLWLVLLPRVLPHWRTPSVGVGFMLTVATESLAVLAALLAIEDRLALLASRRSRRSSSGWAPTCSCSHGSTCGSCCSAAATTGSSAERSQSRRSPARARQRR
jgi:hypothetical protein